MFNLKNKNDVKILNAVLSKLNNNECNIIKMMEKNSFVIRGVYHEAPIADIFNQETYDKIKYYKTEILSVHLKRAYYDKNNEYILVELVKNYNNIVNEPKCDLLLFIEKENLSNNIIKDSNDKININNISVIEKLISKTNYDIKYVKNLEIGSSINLGRFTRNVLKSKYPFYEEIGDSYLFIILTRYDIDDFIITISYDQESRNINTNYINFESFNTYYINDNIKSEIEKISKDLKNTNDNLNNIIKLLNDKK